MAVVSRRCARRCDKPCRCVRSTPLHLLLLAPCESLSFWLFLGALLSTFASHLGHLPGRALDSPSAKMWAMQKEEDPNRLTELVLESMEFGSQLETERAALQDRFERILKVQALHQSSSYVVKDLSHIGQ